MPDPVRYPLYWPDNQPRFADYDRTRFPSNTRWTVHSVWGELFGEIERLTGRHCPWVVSTSAEWSEREGRPKSYEPNDPGAALWFKRASNGPWLCIACDRFDTLAGNLRAIHLIVEGRRREERYGTTAMIESAWSAFEVKALPVAYEPWWLVLGIPADASLQEAEAAYKLKALRAHPDRGGTDGDMARLNNAIDEARKHFAEEANG